MEIESGAPTRPAHPRPRPHARRGARAPCDLLKVDCEGGEFEIFGASSLDVIRRARRIVLKFHRVVGEPQDLIDRLEESGFAVGFLSGAEPDASFGVLGGHRIDPRPGSRSSAPA